MILAGRLHGANEMGKTFYDAILSIHTTARHRAQLHPGCCVAHWSITDVTPLI